MSIMSIKFKVWAKRAGIRAVKTVAQTMIATIGTTATIGAVDWQIVISASFLSGILSVLTSVATGLPEVDYEMQDIEDVEDGDIDADQ